MEEEVNPSPAQEEEETAGALAYPFAVVVDNLAAARPQSGLEGAAVVVEGLAEGGITRYFAVFTHDPGTAIGPVRSARIYFNRLAHLWGLPVAHVGGNKDALEDWNRYPAYDIDDIRRGGGAFYRIQDRKAPHSTYTTAERVQKVLAGRSLPPAQLEFSRGPLPEGGEPVAGVELSYRQAKQVYRVEWHYEEGEWRRYLDGKSDRSADGVVLTAANVLVMVAPVRPKEDPWTAGAIDIDFEHPRKAWLLREGVVTACRVEWTANGLRLTSLLPAGSDLPLSRGNLWIQWVKEEGDVAWLDSNG
ncbi:MAG: DUF3048 domain-containing protein [Bacillota bacterium]|nr:DUF3048 domain-containing protein [Bacillota bacterium]